MVDHLNRSKFLRRVTAGVHILCYRSLRYRLQLLMYHCQSFVKGFIRIVDLYFFPVQIDLSFIHMINAEQTFHQGGFTGAVLSHQCMDGTGTNFEVYLVQSLNARETFRYPAHLQSVLCHPILSFHKIGCAICTPDTLFTPLQGSDMFITVLL